MQKVAWTRLTSDFLVLAMLVATMIIFQRLEPHRSGYFTEDTSIAKIYHSSTVPSYIMYIVTGFAIGITVLVVELVLHRKVLKEKVHGVPVVLYALYNYWIIFLAGYLATIAGVDIFKVQVGRLRPNFFTSCNPKVLEKTNLGFVTRYSCQKSLVEDPYAPWKSFPSGHTATSLYSATVLTIYLQTRVKHNSFIAAPKLFAQTCFISLGLYVAYTRICDNKHHWSDVFFGGLIGICIGIAYIFYLPNVYPKAAEKYNPSLSHEESSASEMGDNGSVQNSHNSSP